MRLVAFGAAGVLLAAAMALALDRPAALGQEPPEPGSVERGEALYEVGCQVCHGPVGGGFEPWPAIVEAGEAAADFQLRTGRMPHTGEPNEQALPKPPAYDEQEIRDLVAFVGSISSGPDIPDVQPDDALLQRGYELYSVNCAPCHGSTGNGGAVGAGAIAWPIAGAEPRIVGEAMLSGPGQMPVFDLPAEEIDAVATYVRYLGTAPDPGGFAIGGIGPVPEGFVAWLAGMGALVVIVVLVGRPWKRKDDLP